MAQAHCAMLAAAVLAAVLCVAKADGWQRARATWYDDSPWMSVHTGSCMYGYLGDRFGGKNNWMVGAINDGNSQYAGSCGRCYEVKCTPGSFTDAMGNYIDRTHDCYNQDPVIIAITDTCPCYKAENLYSNKRWCCGDMPHFDLGVWAFRKMADPNKGVIMISSRPVECPANFGQQLNPGIQTASSLRTQYPGDDLKITAFSGKSQSGK